MWIWADFILIGFSPKNKIDNAKQRENGETRKISDAEQALSRPGISRFVSAKGELVDVFGSLKTATATKKVNKPCQVVKHVLGQGPAVSCDGQIGLEECKSVSDKQLVCLSSHLDHQRPEGQ